MDMHRYLNNKGIQLYIYELEKRWVGTSLSLEKTRDETEPCLISSSYSFLPYEEWVDLHTEWEKFRPQRANCDAPSMIIVKRGWCSNRVIRALCSKALFLPTRINIITSKTHISFLFQVEIKIPLGRPDWTCAHQSLLTRMKDNSSPIWFMKLNVAT